MNSKIIRLGLSLVAALATLAPLSAQTAAPKLDLPAPSPTSTLKQRVGVTDIEIVYSRPGVKGRKIFGGLEPWGEVWRAGANSATKVTFSTPVKFGGQDVPAGTFGLFAKIGEASWNVILTKAPNQWGSYAYNPKDDVANVAVKPVKLAELVETFTIDLNDIRDSSATLNLIWEKTRVPVKIEIDTVGMLVPKIEEIMASAEPKKPYMPAAMFYLDNSLDLKKALAWSEAAIAEQPNAFYLVYRKAKIQAALGDKAGALASAKASLEGANKANGAIKDEYVRLNEALIASLK
ncbi:MAG TPA: DUF2911 domain-containing protein [Opitutaceae bacterium]|nr:DUF2911 domain-containing protein [Opitutaceae bacterium]